MSQAEKPSTTRRALFAAAAVATVAAPTLAQAGAATDYSALHRRIDEMNRVRIEMSRRKGVSDAELNAAHDTFEGPLLREIEVLPLTLDAAKVRARAIDALYDGRIADMFDQKTTDHRLAVQVLNSLLAVR